MTKVPKYCESCFGDDVVLNIDIAIRGAGLGRRGFEKGWSRVRMKMEREEFRERVRREMVG